MNRFAKKRLFHPKAGAEGRRRYGVYYRSRWEFNISLWLDFLKHRGEVMDWTYEEKEFAFPVKRGTRFYKPDFHVIEPNEVEYFIEVKGFLDRKSVTQLARMERYYPKVTVLIMDEKRYLEIEAEFGHQIPEWEKK